LWNDVAQIIFDNFFKKKIIVVDKWYLFVYIVYREKEKIRRRKDMEEKIIQKQIEKIKELTKHAIIENRESANLTIEISQNLEKIFSIVKEQYGLLLNFGDRARARWFLLNIYLPAGKLADKAGDFCKN
jgi:hypothetical protein